MKVMRIRALSLWLIALMAATLTFGPSGASPLPQAPDCPILPADNPWNQRVDRLPVHQRSGRIIRSIGRSGTLHPDFGAELWKGAPIGIPFVTVGADQERVPVTFLYDDESDPGPYPVPPDVPIEGGSDSDGDRHVLVVDRDACTLYEMFDAHPVEEGASWDAGSGATWDLTSNALRPKGWTSADAAGLPILPGLARFDEVKAGAINHALRLTVSRSRRHYVYPARHFASNLTSKSLPSMGQRLRLKRSFDISTYPRQARIILRALKRYGMIVADNGSDWFISGAPDPRWNDDALRTLKNVAGRHFEVVRAGSLRP